MRLILFFQLLFFTIVPNAPAELVLTRLTSAQRGHAWLFGSPVDGSCWIAAPAHVLRGSDGLLQKAILYLKDSSENHLSEVPVQPDPEVDLAFAPLSIDRPCLDRLGMRDITDLIQTADSVKLSVLMSSGQEGISVRVRSLNLSGREIIVEPLKKEEKLKQGFSGGLVSAAREGLGKRNVPLGILLKVCDTDTSDMVEDDFADDAPANSCDNEHHYGIALRFDEIRRLFANHLDKVSRVEQTITEAAKLRIELLSTTGQTIDAEQGPGNSFSQIANLTNRQVSSVDFEGDSPAALIDSKGSSCWRSISDKSKKVSATIRVTGGTLKRIKVYPCSDANESELPMGMGVYYRTKNTLVWSSLRYCRSKADAPTLIDCSFLPRNDVDMYLLEFKSKGKDKLMALGTINVE